MNKNERGLIISFIGQKGGAGKSTTCENVAAELATTYNADVLLMDCDPKQRTSSKWVMRRNESIDSGAPLKTIHNSIQNENIKEAALDAAGRYDVVILDPEGRDGKALRYALIVSDIIYIPVQPTQPDLETLEYLDDLIQETKEANPKRVIRVLLTRTPTHPTNADKLLAERYICDLSSALPISSAYICDRMAYKKATVSGIGVIEGNDPSWAKAKLEVQKLVKEILENV